MNKRVKAIIILPNWLGDAVMATPAVESLVTNFKGIDIVAVGSFLSIEIFKHHPNVIKTYIDHSKKSPNRAYAIYRFCKDVYKDTGIFDIAINFRNTFYSSLMLKFINSKKKIVRKSLVNKILFIENIDVKNKNHLCQKYSALIEKLLNKTIQTPPLKIHIKRKQGDKKLLGINPGATYGNAKRWYIEEFAKVIEHFYKEFDIIIFGGKNEVKIANDIEQMIKSKGIKNYTNLSSKTTIQELCEHISSLSLFITNDSGPMHVASAYDIPTISIFGSTNHIETSSWNSKFNIIVRKDMLCSPCMKRECPLKHHNCMKEIKADDVIKQMKKII